MNVVPRRQTPSNEQELRALLSLAWERATGALPSSNLLAFNLAQTFIETDGWRAIQNHNIGNITASESYRGDAWRPPWFTPETFRNERDEVLHGRMLAGKAPRAFRAYGSLIEGVTDYVARLQKDFPEIVEAAETGDAFEVATAIHQKYCPDDECAPERNAPGLERLARRFGANAQVQPTPGVVGSSGVAVSSAAVAVASLAVLALAFGVFK